MSDPLSIVVLVLVLVFLSSAFQGFLGFGYALLILPLFDLFFNWTAATSLVFCNATFAGHCLVMSVILWKAKQIPRIDCLLVILFLIPTILFVPDVVLEFLKFKFTRAILGLVVFSIAVHQLRATIRKPKRKRIENDTETIHPSNENEQRILGRSHKKSILLGLWAAVAGSITGLVALLFSTTGPPLLIYGRTRGWDGSRFRRFAQPVFLWGALLACLRYYYASKADPVFSTAWDNLMVTAVMSFPVVLIAFGFVVCSGTLLGNFANRRLADRGEKGKFVFEILFCGFLAILGISMIWRNLTQI